MANVQATFGFSHYGYLPGYAPDYQLSKYAIQSTYVTAIYFGDPVIKSAAAGTTFGGYIQPATGTGSLTTVVGIFQGCQYVAKGGIPTWFPWYPGVAAQSDTVAYVMDSPGALFKVAAVNTPVPATAIGQNIGYSTGAGGTTLGGGFSTYTVDQTTLTTGSIAPFTVVKMYDGIGNGSDPTTAYNWIIVGFNTQRYRAGGTGLA